MTKLLEKALEAVRNHSTKEQDEIATAMLLLAERDEHEEIDSSHLVSVLCGLTQAERREFSSDDETEAALRRFDR